MAESSSAGPSSQGQVPLASLDIERGPAEPNPSQGSPDPRDAVEDHIFLHLYVPDKHAALIESMPPGWIKLAAERNLFHHRRFCRRFGTLYQKLILSGQTHLAAKECEIDEVLKGPGGSERFTWADPLFRETRDDCLALGRLVQMDDYFRNLPEAHIDQQVAAYEHMRLDHKFSEAESAYMLRHEDMVQPQTDRTDLIINSLLYGPSKGAIHDWIRRAIYYLFGEDVPKKYGGTRPINLDRLNLWFVLFVMLVAELALLMPVLVLYLVSMTKRATAGVVVAFIILLTPFIYIIATTRFGHAIFGLFAYMAILVAFLAQLDNGISSGS